MSRNIYDNWGKLVEATLKREKLRELGLAQSRETSFSSSISANFSSHFTFKFKSLKHGEPGNYNSHVQAWTDLMDQVIKAADAAASFKQECMDLKQKTQQLKLLIHHAAHVSDTLYYRPYNRIMDDTKEVLHMAANLVMKCSSMRRMFTNIPATALTTMSSQIEHCIKNISWLLRDEEYLGGSPPIAVDEPTLCYIWELIAILTTGSDVDQLDAAASLASLAQDGPYCKLIIEEGGVHALLRLLNQGKMVGQEYAARAIGLLGKDPESVRQIMSAGTCTFFARILKQGPTNVQAMVAWAASELAANDPQCQPKFEQHNIIQLLISHLSRERWLNAQHKMVSNGNDGTSQKENASVYMKAMAARALWHLGKGNYTICQIITNSSGLFHLAILLEQGPKEVQFYSVMALMEISAMAEKDASFRRSSFRPNSPVCQAIVKQLFRLIEMADPELLVPCVRTVGHLARIFRATDTGTINPLVKLLDDKDQGADVSKEACIALAKFACSENFLCVEYSNIIVAAGGASRLVQLVYSSGDKTVQVHALELLCYIAKNLPGGAIHSEVKITSVLEWVSKQAYLMEDVDELLLHDARTRLELYQSRLYP